VALGVAVIDARAVVVPDAERELRALRVGKDGKAVGLAVPDAVGVVLSDAVALAEAAALAEARAVSELERDALSVALTVALVERVLLAEPVSEPTALEEPEAVGRADAEKRALALTVMLGERVAETVVEADEVALAEKDADNDGCDVGVARGLMEPESEACAVTDMSDD
jgi:hypothetical protein